MHAFDDDIAVPAAAAARESDAPSRLSADGITTNAPAAGAVQNAASLLSLQRRAGNAGVVQLMREGDGDGDPHGLQSMLNGGGSPLDTPTRVQMESAIGADFSSVRIHTGGDADRSAKSFGAHAYTAGENVVFAAGRYDPGSAAGQHTLAHELTHVVQQRSGPVDGTTTSTGVKVSDPSDPFERAAEANADRVTSLQTKAADPVAAAPAVPAHPVQREADDLDEVQTMADPTASIQREGEDEVEEGAEVQTLAESVAIQREGDDEMEEGAEVQTLAESVAIQREGDDEMEEGAEVQTLADPTTSIQREGEEEEEVG